jgi:coproporphyrinogen III oxidase
MSRFGRLTFREKSPFVHWTGGCMDLKAVLDFKMSIKYYYREQKPGCPERSQVLYRKK